MTSLCKTNDKSCRKLSETYKIKLFIETKRDKNLISTGWNRSKEYKFILKQRKCIKSALSSKLYFQKNTEFTNVPILYPHKKGYSYRDNSFRNVFFGIKQSLHEYAYMMMITT